MMKVKNFVMCLGWFVAGIAIAGIRPSTAMMDGGQPVGFTVKAMKIDPAYQVADRPTIPASWRLAGVGSYGGMGVLWFQDPQGGVYGVQTIYDQGEMMVRSPNISKLEAK